MPRPSHSRSSWCSDELDAKLFDGNSEGTDTHTVTPAGRRREERDAAVSGRIEYAAAL